MVPDTAVFLLFQNCYQTLHAIRDRALLRNTVDLLIVQSGTAGSLVR